MTDHERIKQALALNQETRRIHQYYDDWSAEYDQDVADEHYAGPEAIAQLAAALYTNRNDDGDRAVRAHARVFDAGCGTGLVGVALQVAGFHHIIGADLSPKMIREAQKTGAYEQLCAPLDLTQPIAAQLCQQLNEDAFSGAFDLTVCVGVFTLGHVPPSVIYALTEVTRSGGLVMVSAREEYCDTHHFEHVCHELEAEGIATVEHADWGPYVSDDRALYIALRVL